MAAVLKISTNEQNFINGLKRASGSVGELAGTMNVKLANSFKAADFYTKNFEKGLGRLANSFKDVGQGMTLGLTLPLGLLGKSASDAFADIDALRRALGTVESTSEGLTSRLKELREVAKLPGIGFEEAIQGDVRLRSVGISAERSAKILREFSNAVAMGGGGKEKLNEVTTQLAQMYNKGKVMAQDFRSIMENAPPVGMAAKILFGTTNSEQIQEQLEATGKGSAEFIDMILAQMAKAPRVTGGWKNSLENLSDTLKIAKADMFEVAANIFDLQGKMEGIAKTVEGFVQGFKDLPEPVQKTILGLTALIAIAGPLTYGIGLLTTSLTFLVTTAGITTMTIGGLVTLFGALSFMMLQDIAATERFNKATQDLNTTKEEARVSTDKEARNLQNLISILQSASSTTKQVKDAKKALIAINPEYKSALEGEVINYAKLNDVTSKTISNLIKVAEKKKLVAQMDAAVGALEELRSGGGITYGETMDAYLSTATGDGFMELWDKRIKKAGGLLDYEKELIFVKATKLSNTIQKLTTTLNKDYGGLSEASGGGSGEGKTFAPLSEKDKGKAKITMEDHIKDVEKFAINRRKAMDKITNQAIEDRIELAKAIEMEMDTSNLPKAPDIDKNRADAINWAFTFGKDSPLKGLSEEEVDAWKKINGISKDGQNEYTEQFKKMKDDLHNVLGEISVDFGADLIDGLIGGQGFEGAMSNMLTSLGNVMIQFGKQALLANNAFKAFKLAFNIEPGSKGATMKALSLIAGGAIMKGLGSKIPKLAEGGMATNPTLAMIGDNKSGKEMVLPFEKTGQFANMIAQQMGGGGGDFIHTTRISGNDLLILTERAKRAR